jgi:hypothetical protein
MTEEQFERWATASNRRAEPSSSLKSTGYTDGSQPAAKNWNWLAGELIDKVNNIIRRIPSGLQEDTTLNTLASNHPNIFARYYPKSDTATWDIVNGYGSADRLTYPLGDKAIVGLCPWYDTTNDVQKILCLEGDTSRNVIEFDKINWTVSNSGDLGGSNLPAGTWIPQAMCTDGTYVYITFYDTAGGTHRIQAYDPSSWSRKTSWPTTGTAISGTGACATAWCLGDVRVVSPTLIGVSCPWTTSGGLATDKLFATYNISNGALVSEGAGSCTAGFINTIASNSTDIFGINVNNARVERATIASLGVAPATYPYNGSGLLDVMCIGNMVISSSAAGASILNFGTSAETQLCDSATGESRLCYTGGRMEFDGSGIWMRGTVLVNATEKNAIIKVDPSSVSIESAGTGYAMSTIEKIYKTCFVLDGLASVNDYYQAMAPICFDGRDIWAIGDQRSGQTLSGDLYRVPKAVLR